MATHYDIIVIGGGIVGLASAFKILELKPDARLLLLEKEDGLVKHQTGNNSGVIHSGIYYKPGSLKAKNCTYGYQLLLSFCSKYNIPFELCGKVIVAKNDKELPFLNELFRRGEANGLRGLRKLNAEQIKEIEPHAIGIAGIYVPQTGITDFIQVSMKYAEIIKEMGGEILCREKVTDLKSNGATIEVVTGNSVFESKFVLGCAGLQSDRIARLTHPDLPLRIIPFRGEYYKLKKEKTFLIKNLLYPVPDPNFPFLGVHFTRLIEGGVECGPNAVLAFKREGYRKSDFNLKDTFETLTWGGFRKVASKYWRMGVGEFYRSYNKKAFTRALQELIPEVAEDDLESGGAGVRAQACNREGGLLDDFNIFEDGNIIHVCNAPSPAATSSLSIGETIAMKIINKM
jgi:L-2-hydroxyglutarate oxidase